MPYSKEVESAVAEMMKPGLDAIVDKFPLATAEDALRLALAIARAEYGLAEALDLDYDALTTCVAIEMRLERAMKRLDAGAEEGSHD